MMNAKVLVMAAALAAAGSEAQAADTYLGAVGEKALDGARHLVLAPTELISEPIAAGIAFDRWGALAPIGMVIPGIPLAVVGTAARVVFGVSNLATCLITSPERPKSKHRWVLLGDTL
jgi:hypothetical protein